MASPGWKPSSDWKFLRGQLVLPLDLLLAAVVIQLLLDRWIAVFLASFQDTSLISLLAHLPESVALALLFLGGVVFFLAYRAIWGDCLRADRGMFVLGCGIVSASAADMSKIFFGRLRPDALVRDDQYGFHLLKGTDGFDSFPSSHAAIAMAIAGAASLLWPKHRFIFMTTAVAVAFSRVLIQRHFLSDMLAGLALGLCIVVLIQILFDRCGIQLNAPRSPSNPG